MLLTVREVAELTGHTEGKNMSKKEQKYLHLVAGSVGRQAPLF